MKRIKAINGYTIYQATTQRDADNYNCEIGEYSIYLSSDIRDFGLANSYPEYDRVDALSVAVAMCNGSSYAVACELAEELSNSTIQDMDLVLEIERRLDAGEALDSVRESYDTEEQRFTHDCIGNAFDPYEDHPAIGQYGAVLPPDECPIDENVPEDEELVDYPANTHRSHASYAVLRDPDDGEYVTLSAPRKEGLDTQAKRDDWLLVTVSQHLAFSDCGGWDVDEIVIDGEPLEYMGWQPGMLYEYRSLSTGEIVWSESFPGWDH